MQKLNFSIIFVNYFTTIHELNKKEENKNNEEESKSQNINKDEIINEKDEKNNEEENEKEDDDEEQINSRNKIFYRNKIDDNEEKILKKFDQGSSGTMTKLEYVTSMSKLFPEFNDDDHMRFIRIMELLDKNNKVIYPELLNIIFYSNVHIFFTSIISLLV